MNEINLETIGINKAEYAVYREILSNPPTNIVALAKNTNVNRTTLYQVLKTLEEKGLITEVKDAKSKIKYIATSPEKLLIFAEQRKQSLENEIHSLKKEIPLLSSIAKNINIENSNFVVLKGPNAQDNVEKLVAASNEMITGFSYEYNTEQCFILDDKGKIIENDYYKAVIKNGDKFVFPADEVRLLQAKELIKNNPALKNKWNPRWIEKAKFPFDINIYCFEDTVIFSHGSKLQQDYIAYIIKDQKLANSIKGLSIMVWENANKIV